MEIKRNNGFTLIELLVVVLIIGILASIALPQYQKAVMKSRYVGALAIMQSLKAPTMEFYYANGRWPYMTETADLLDYANKSCNVADCRVGNYKVEMSAVMGHVMYKAYYWPEGATLDSTIGAGLDTGFMMGWDESTLRYTCISKGAVARKICETMKVAGSGQVSSSGGTLGRSSYVFTEK